MKIDEAISLLKQYIDYNNPDIPDFYTMEEACEVVIEALQQEPCENVPDLYECPCGYGWDKNKVVRHHFCPNCGRAVDGSIITEQEPSGDCISREATIKTISEWFFSKEFRFTNASEYLRKRLDKLPSLTPQPKMGKWVYNKKEDSYKCSLCGFPCHKDNLGAIPTNYCANCGSYNGGER